MPGIGLTVEWMLGRLLSSSRGYDHGLLINAPAIKHSPESIQVTSDLGPSGSLLKIEHSGLGVEGNKDIFPTIHWKVDTTIAEQIKEYCFVCEDADSPLPPSVIQAVHGVFFAIPPNKIDISNEDLKLDESRSPDPKGPRWAKGGFRLGQNIKGETYAGPKPPCGHGNHRYFYQVIALKQPLESGQMTAVPTRAELQLHLEGKVLAHGSWIGNFENKGT